MVGEAVQQRAGEPLGSQLCQTACSSSRTTGRQPTELTARKLMADTRLPLDWSEQRIQLGFT